jgi:hypothetical protein
MFVWGWKNDRSVGLDSCVGQFSNKFVYTLENMICGYIMRIANKKSSATDTDMQKIIEASGRTNSLWHSGGVTLTQTNADFNYGAANFVDHFGQSRLRLLP